MSNSVLLASELGCSSFELRKSSRGYSWNIKIYDLDIKKSYDIAKQVDQQAKKDYGTLEEIE